MGEGSNRPNNACILNQCLLGRFHGGIPYYLTTINCQNSLLSDNGTVQLEHLKFPRLVFKECTRMDLEEGKKVPREASWSIHELWQGLLGMDIFQIAFEST